MHISSIVLAAGLGKRMKSKLYKVLHPVCGKPMVGHVLDALTQVPVDRNVVVVGHGAEAVKSYLGDKVEFALQAEQLGTGHAVMQARSLLEQEQGITIVACGDSPLIRASTLKSMVELHQQEQAAVTILTAEVADPQGYGRVIRDENGLVVAVVEQKDCTPEQAGIREINAGTYCFDTQLLFEALDKVTNHNAQQEYYLTDVIQILKNEGKRIVAYRTDDPSEAVGVNDRAALSMAERLMRERLIREHMVNGVTVIDPANTYIEKDVQIGPDTVLLPGCMIRGGTVIGSECVIGPYTEIDDCIIGDRVTIRHSVLTEAKVGHDVNIGPFAYLRPGTQLADKVKIGDFVEVKNSIVGEGSKIPHLSYVGDARVGVSVNIGCGTITCNYDGLNKSVTEIGDGAFIGSNSNLVAPVKIGKDAYVVAGSTITKDVGDGDMAIARERQVNKPGYAAILRSRLQAKKPT